MSRQQVPLSATAWWDGSDVEGPKKGRRQLSYVAFGAAVSEVEVDLLTGEKMLLRTDILFDCGHSMNPGIDIGQASRPNPLSLHRLMLVHAKRLLVILDPKALMRRCCSPMHCGSLSAAKCSSWPDAELITRHSSIGQASLILLLRTPCFI